MRIQRRAVNGITLGSWHERAGTKIDGQLRRVDEVHTDGIISYSESRSTAVSMESSATGSPCPCVKQEKASLSASS